MLLLLLVASHSRAPPLLLVADGFLFIRRLIARCHPATAAVAIYAVVTGQVPGPGARHVLGRSKYLLIIGHLAVLGIHQLRHTQTQTRSVIRLQLRHCCQLRNTDGGSNVAISSELLSM
ncbi:hypothetical protein C8R44DRAFT_740475 [Mycena epipterygia]|nr:hypothetical protein C8R44DRAFT_740475 [Mycena epipterygia]